MTRPDRVERRRSLALMACLAGLLVGLIGPVALGADPARAATAAWQLEQPAPPPTPSGVNGVGAPIGLGQVGDIKFWAPNRGLLITGGNAPAVPKGLYAYDGVSWHLLSTVCGSAAGRIAWVGPDEFWTISDPAPNSSDTAGKGDTLCHFVNGAVAASYATPSGSDDPYQEMFAAACDGPNDCWFAGGDARPPLTGAFHLHWDGTALTDALSPADRTVDGLVMTGSQFIESDAVGNGDQPVTAEPSPVLIHRIVPGLAAAEEFPADPFMPVSCPATPDYLTLGTDGSDVWAVGGGTGAFSTGPCPRRPAMAARLVGGNFQELGVDPTAFAAPSAFLSVAPEPGASDAWVTVGAPGYATGSVPGEIPPFPRATVARIANDGSTLRVDTVPDPSTGLTAHGGAAGPIACPAMNDCWMVTKEGWLYHLTDGTLHAQDTDPHFAGVIDLRPPDAGTASFPPDTSPLDTSLANQVHVVLPPTQPPPRQAKVVPVVTHVSKPTLHGLTLVLSFTLNFKAKVTFSATRHHKLVATTGTHTLSKGRHTLKLRLNRKRFPDNLSFKVTLVKTKGPLRP